MTRSGSNKLVTRINLGCSESKSSSYSLSRFWRGFVCLQSSVSSVPVPWLWLGVLGHEHRNFVPVLKRYLKDKPLGTSWRWVLLREGLLYTLRGKCWLPAYMVASDQGIEGRVCGWRHSSISQTPSNKPWSIPISCPSWSTCVVIRQLERICQ